MAILRDYQKDCLGAIKARMGDINRQLVALPTGTGKTMIFAHLPEVLGKKKMLVLAHREELLDQAADKIGAANPGLDVQIEQADRYASPAADVVIASVPTIGRKGSARIQNFDPDGFPVIAALRDALNADRAGVGVHHDFGDNHTALMLYVVYSF